MTEKDVNDILRYIKSLYSEEYADKLKKVYLYGSYARGNYGDYSDVDIAGIVEGERLDLQNRLKHIWDKTPELLDRYDVIVSPTVIPYNEFEDYKDVLPYYRNIVNEDIET
ncbi:MAG: nucleotidyltransferase domain-containing protein [Catonella sp.]|nr:nucleotidyltransferase domain-containing protein [Catonella sp.]MDY6355791.1 nucleotidyltransferase domain-containing protein [Catonella sp.]